MYLSNLPSKTHAPETIHKKLQGVSMLGEDNELLVSVFGIGQYLAQLVELGFMSRS
jgi:hypothetical protein